MPRSSLITKLTILLEMIKIQHTVFALPFAFMGALLGARGLPSGRQAFFILLAMAGARSAAMAFNRLADQRFDAANPRTRDRALPAGLVSRGATWVFIAMSALVFIGAAEPAEPPVPATFPPGVGGGILLFLHQALQLGLPLFPGRCPTIAGARTGLVGGCVPNQGALVSLENFDRVLALYYDAPSAEWRLKAQCAVNLRTIAAQLAVKSIPDIERCADGMTLSEMERFRQDPDYYAYPPDPTEMSASLGGTVATNASGARTFRHGPTRDWVRGIRVMLVNGEILDLPRGKYFASPGGEFTVTESAGNDYKVRIPGYGSPRTKNTAGFFTASHIDLVDVFIGSEGAFGIITEVTVGLLKRAPKISVVQFLSKRHMWATYGNTGINGPLETIKVYLDSMEKWFTYVDSLKPDIAISSHPFVDGSIRGRELIRECDDKHGHHKFGRHDQCGPHNPFLLGREGARRYFEIMNQCAVVRYEREAAGLPANGLGPSEAP